MTDEQGIIYSDDGKVVLGVTDDFDATEVIIPEGVIDIECHSLDHEIITKISLPTTLQRIGCDLGFRNNVKIEVIKPFESLTLYGEDFYEYYGVIHVKKILLESATLTIESATFQGWEHLEEVVIKSNIETITENALAGCKNLKKVTFCGDCDTIKTGAFAGCDKLEEINIPATTKIEDGAFDGKNAWRNKFVDLGLPSGTLWARCNWGAKDDCPEDAGECLFYDEWVDKGLDLPSRVDWAELVQYAKLKKSEKALSNEVIYIPLERGEAWHDTYIDPGCGKWKETDYGFVSYTIPQKGYVRTIAKRR